MQETNAVNQLEECGYQQGDLIPVRVVADVWGVTPRQIRQLGIDPSRVDQVEVQTWTYLSYEQVVELHDDPRVVAARRRHQEDQEDWDPPADWRDALSTAAVAMLVVTVMGYVHGGEAGLRASSLRPRFLRCLWDHGYCSAIVRATQLEEEHICDLCRGVGCEVCDDKGIWWPRREIEIYTFMLDLPQGSCQLSAAAGEVPWARQSVVSGLTRSIGDGVLDPDPWYPWDYRGDQYVPPAIVPMPPPRAYRILTWTIEQAEQAA
jgi:hypothetical protein